MKAFICIAYLGSVLLSFSTIRAQNVEILMTGGTFHKDQVNAQSGEEWYGLFAERHNYNLVRTTIQVTPGEWIEDKEGEKTGRIVSCDRPGKPLFLVRGIDGLSEREVTTEFHGKNFFYPGQRMQVEGGLITLTAFGTYQKNERPFSTGLRNYSVEYTIRGQDWHQYHLLAEYPVLTAEEGLPNLIWVGDLDNDGWVDMFWDLSGHYAVHIYTLFLSSLTKEGFLSSVTKGGEAVVKAAELKISIGT